MRSLLKDTDPDGDKLTYSLKTAPAGMNIEQSIRGRINVYKVIGERYIKVTYKEFSEEVLIISIVDKGGG